MLGDVVWVPDVNISQDNILFGAPYDEVRYNKGECSPAPRMVVGAYPLYD